MQSVWCGSNITNRYGEGFISLEIFLKDAKQSAKCNFCHKSLKTTDGTTSALRRHLKKHPSEINKLTLAEKERDTAPPPQKKSRLDSHSHSSSQPTLNEFTSKFSKYGPQSSLQMNFDELMVDMLCCTGTPFWWVEHPTTVKLFDLTNPKFSLKHRTTYSRMVSDRAESVMTRVHNILQY